MSIVLCDIVQFSIFVLILGKTKIQRSMKYFKHTEYSAENDVFLLKIFNIGIYSANMKKDWNTKSLLCFLKDFSPLGEGEGLWDKFI